MAHPKPVRPEPVEGLLFSSQKERQGFDKLSPNGLRLLDA
jgi:hypothetical protein